MAEEKCETCRFFLDRRPTELSASERALSYGYCRCHPPTVIPREAASERSSLAHTAWPVVAKEDWCGEHKPISGESSPAMII
jgi:hypothetical protein